MPDSHWPLVQSSQLTIGQFQTIGRLANMESMRKSEIMPSFQQALTRHIEEANEDVTTLAKRADVSRDALYKVIYGKTKSPNLEIIIRVARAYGKTVEEFMGIAPARVQDDLIDEISRLAPSERAVLQASLKALRAQRIAEPEDIE